MKLIVGLGNPTDKYLNTRHNIGYMALDFHLQNKGLKPSKKFNAIVYQAAKIIYLKPETFMNLSGEAVIKTMQYFKISPEDILVVYDDLDLAPGLVRIREKGGTGGHKGMRSIFEHTHTENIARIRIGIGKDADAKNYVLKPIPKKEVPMYRTAFEMVDQALEAFIAGQPMEYLMNHYQISDSPS